MIVFEDKFAVRVASSEQRWLWTQFSQSIRDEQTRVVTTRGAAGIGKTALCEWLKSMAHEYADAMELLIDNTPYDGTTLVPLIRAFGEFNLENYDEETYTAVIAVQAACNDRRSLTSPRLRKPPISGTVVLHLRRSMVIPTYPQLLWAADLATTKALVSTH